MQGKIMDRSDLRELIVGPIANVPTHFDDRFRVDYGRMAESGLVKGNAVIKVAVAMGEIAHIRDDEWGPLLKTTVQAAKDKATVMCDIHYKDTLCTIEDAKRAADLGAVGVQVTPLIFNDPTQDDILRFFEDLRNHLLRMEPPRYLQPALFVISNNWPTSCYSAILLSR